MGVLLSSLSASIMGPFIHKKATELYEPIELVITQNNYELWEKLSVVIHDSTKLLNTQKYMIKTENNMELFIPVNRYYRIFKQPF